MWSTGDRWNVAMQSSAPLHAMDPSPRRGFLDLLESWLPRIVVAPTFLLCLFFIYGYILWTAVLSYTSSRLLPSYDFIGIAQYVALFANERWWVALQNLFLFGVCFIGASLFIGL